MFQVIQLLPCSSNNLGGIASVAKDILKLNRENLDFRISAQWIEDKIQPEPSVVSGVKNRLLSKFNRTLCIDPNLHPYRFPPASVEDGGAMRFQDRSVLHVHKANLWRYAARLKAENPEIRLVFHAHSVDGFTGGCILESQCEQLREECRKCPILRSPVVGLAHLGFKSQAELLRRARPLIIANSAATHKAITSSNLIPDHCRVEIVEPGTDAEAFYPRAEPGQPEAERTTAIKVGFIAYSIENQNKGFLDFSRAVDLLRRRLPIEGYAAGDFRQSTAARFPEIRFEGPLAGDHRLREFYQKLDYLIVPSRSESFGKVSVEAQYCGTPVICYDVGGLPETILDGETGSVIRPASAEAIAGRILELGGRVSMRKNLLRSEIKQKLLRFETHQINARYRAIYESLLAA